MTKPNQKYSHMLKIRSKFLFFTLIIILVLTSTTNSTQAQTEVMAWGNITGIRVEGQLMEFESSLNVIAKDWKQMIATGKEKQQPGYKRNGLKQIVSTKIGNIAFTQTVEDVENGIAIVTIETIAEKDSLLEGVFFCIELPDTYYSNGLLDFKSTKKKSELILTEFKTETFEISAKGFRALGLKRGLEIDFKTKTNISVRKNKNGNNQVFIELLGKKIKKGDNSLHVFTIKTTGEIDHSPAKITLDIKNPGQKFDGLGGNFRLQNPNTDPQVIQYCLDNLRVAWGRVEMPWQFWHPNENEDPMVTANSGKLNPKVRAAMEMARRLAKKGMPVIVSDWSAPNWAIEGDPRDAYRLRSQGIYGYPLKKEKKEKIYQSIGDYLVYLKQNYGVEAAMFSFNESDLGINVRHTGEEHATFIKELGKHLASRGLATKLLLGDNSDATTFDFIIPAMNDPETHKFIGAISFHSWRGCDDATLKKWREAAKKMNVPLIIGEGSTDAAAWKYPEIFSEQTFALYEINLYTRICAICQPLSILQWQLTADYSVLTGDGVFKTEGPLRPTQRFWNLKQLASTPKNAFSIPASSDKKTLNCAAFGNIAKGEYCIHIVNNGAACNTTIRGIPDEIKVLEVFVTNAENGMKKTEDVKVINGVANFSLEPIGFTTLKNSY